MPLTYKTLYSDILCEIFLSFVLVLYLTEVLTLADGGKFGVLSMR